MEQKHHEDIVITPYIENILLRAEIYLKTGLPIHLTGPAGTGKTTLAMKLARDTRKPVYFMQGDVSFQRQDLVGGLYGFSQKIINDNFIPSVSKMERKVTPLRVDNPVALACREGGVLVYDEFTRSRAEANNVLLGILSERLIMIADEDGRMILEKVHPDFLLILTSNPQEYTGVCSAQDALIDRIVTIKLNGFDEETECAITGRQAQLEQKTAQRLVRFVREIKREYNLNFSTIRTAIKVGKIFHRLFETDFNQSLFFDCCLDVFDQENISAKSLARIWKERTSRG